MDLWRRNQWTIVGGLGSLLAAIVGWLNDYPLVSLSCFAAAFASAVVPTILDAERRRRGDLASIASTADLRLAAIEHAATAAEDLLATSIERGGGALQTYFTSIRDLDISAKGGRLIEELNRSNDLRAFHTRIWVPIRAFEATIGQDADLPPIQRRTLRQLAAAAELTAASIRRLAELQLSLVAARMIGDKATAADAAFRIETGVLGGHLATAVESAESLRGAAIAREG